MMSCRRSTEIDLAAFLAEPRAAAFDAFRRHYPRCADCAAEVAAWTELDEALGASRHPPAAQLARYGELAGAERAAIDRHARDCPSCREELRLLDAFEPSRLRAAAPTAAAQAGPGPIERLTRLLWHPAFAYGVAVLLALPVVTGRIVGPERPVAPSRRNLALEDRAAPAAPVDRGLAKQETAAPDPAHAPDQQRAPELERVVPSERDRRAQGETAFADAAEEGLAPAGASEPPAAGVARETKPDAQAVAQRKRAAAPGVAPRGEAFEARVAEGDDAAFRPDADRAATAALTGEAAAPAAAAKLPDVVLADAPDRVALRVPLAPGAGGTVEVRVSDATGLRTLVERAAPPPGAAAVTIGVPRAWLAPGVYSVEVRHADGATRRHDLRVR